MAPTLIELPALTELAHEVFGPVLHVLRFQRDKLPALLDQIHATGYGLTLGVHSRIDDTISAITQQARVGNIYVNRNMVGAVVGVQPFGGEGLSGTGPKAGGPLYLHRLLAPSADTVSGARTLQHMAGSRPADGVVALDALIGWLQQSARPDAPALIAYGTWLQATSMAGSCTVLRGPTGERNTHSLRPREAVLCRAQEHGELLHQLATVLAAQGQAVWPASGDVPALHAQLPAAVQARIQLTPDWVSSRWDTVLMHGDKQAAIDMGHDLARRPGPIVNLQVAPSGCLDAGVFNVSMLLTERTLSVNTAAAGGNASLLMLD